MAEVLDPTPETFRVFSECKGCSRGMEFCKRPCWGTPEEIEALMDAGYGGRLMLDFWGSTETEDIYFPCPATPGHEGKKAPGSDPFEFFFGMLSGKNPLHQGCNFQSPEGLCELHDLGLKPFEGKSSCCKSNPEDRGNLLHKTAAMSWNTEKGQNVLAKWKSEYLKD